MVPPFRVVAACIVAASLSACATTHQGHESAVDLAGTANVGEAALQAGTPRIASNVAKAILARSPKDAEALTIASTAAWQEDRIPEAISYGKRAVAVAPNSAEARLALGRALDHRNPGRARQEFAAAYRLAPGNLAAAIDYGVACAQNGDAEKAITVLRRAVREHPDSKDARFDLALALSISGRHADAMQAVRILQAMASRQGAPALYKKAYAYAAKQAGMPTSGN